MTWENHRTGTGRNRQTRRDGKQTIRTRRQVLRLLCALAVFLGCWMCVHKIPSMRARTVPVLENLLTCSCDFEEAVRCFSAQLEGGENVGAALGEFCVTAFAVQSDRNVPSEASFFRLAVQEALTYPETAASGF